MKTLFIILFFLSSHTHAGQSRFTASLSKDGKSLRITHGTKKNQVPLLIPEGMVINGDLKVYDSEDLKLVMTQLKDFENETSVVNAFNKEGSQIWSMNLGSFNPSPPLIEKKHVYLSALGKVWKLEKQSGKVVWKHEGLYEKGKFNGDHLISRRGESIVFAQNLRISDLSGKILERGRK